MSERKFKTAMIDYCKNILDKFTFDRSLFMKEYRKSLQYLNAEEQMELKNWLRNTNHNHLIS